MSWEKSVILPVQVFECERWPIWKSIVPVANWSSANTLHKIAQYYIAQIWMCQNATSAIYESRFGYLRSSQGSKLALLRGRIEGSGDSNSDKGSREWNFSSEIGESRWLPGHVCRQDLKRDFAKFDLSLAVLPITAIAVLPGLPEIILLPTLIYTQVHIDPSNTHKEILYTTVYNRQRVWGRPLFTPREHRKGHPRPWSLLDHINDRIKMPRPTIPV